MKRELFIGYPTVSEEEKSTIATKPMTRTIIDENTEVLDQRDQ